MAHSKEKLIAAQLSAANLDKSIANSEIEELLNDYFREEDVESDDSECESLSLSSDSDDVVENIDFENLSKEASQHMKENVGITGENVGVDENDNNCFVLDADESDEEFETQDIVVNDPASVVMDNVAAVNVDICNGVQADATTTTFLCSKNCKLGGNGEPCYNTLDQDKVTEIRDNMKALTDYERDLILLGILSTGMNQSTMTCSQKRSKQTERQRQRTVYCIEGKRVCRETFKYVHAISQDKLSAVITHYKENGLTPRYKKSGGRRKARVLNYNDIVRVVSFITNFAEEHALVLPGRVPGFKRFDIKLLPSIYTKISVFRLYKSAMDEQGDRAVKISSFRQLWRTLVPYIVRTRPLTDLCWECQRNNRAVYQSANLSDEEKAVRLKKQEEHLLHVTRERSLYRTQVEDSKRVLSEHPHLKLATNEPNAVDVSMHYSFDYAQQVHYPSNPWQPGPMYFLCPRKCGIFGVCAEGFPKQVNFLVDESMLIGKGANAVISFLDHFFANYGIGEKIVNLHCDNCSGQNKNNYLIWYLLWRVMCGLHDRIELHFLVAGHTKFAPDWCFGLLKQRYRKSVVSCLDDLVQVVTSSTQCGLSLATHWCMRRHYLSATAELAGFE